MLIGQSNMAEILWHRSENDSHFEKDATTYQQRFIQRITKLRTDLGDENNPVGNLKLRFCKLGRLE